MAWIKRNLYFFLGSIVALALMVAGGFYLFSQISEESKVSEDISKQYEELKRLINQNPHPGYGAIDNIKAAKAQSAALRAYVAKTRPFFQRITPIPDPAAGRITDSIFAAALRNTINQLHHSASNQSVLLPADYYFTFEAQRKIMIFDSASLDKLAVQLGEIKTICDILFNARVNSLDYIRREIVSPDDKNQSDYLTQKTTSTPLVELTPYEVKFHCFSTELALVLGNLASSSNGFIVKTINIEPTATGAEEPANGQNTMIQVVSPQLPPGQDARYSRLGDGRSARMAQTTPGIPTAAPPPRGPQDFLKEKVFTVTLLVQVVKTKPIK